MTADPGTPDAAAAATDGRDRETVTADVGTLHAAADGRAAGPTDAHEVVPVSGGGAPAAVGAAPRVVFCGGCNPHIDRGAVAAELAAASGGQADEATGAAKADGGATAGNVADGGAAATVYLSGCPRACASGHRLTGDAPGDVVVAGEVVDGRPMPADDIAATIRQKLKE